MRDPVSRDFSYVYDRIYKLEKKLKKYEELFVIEEQNNSKRLFINSSVGIKGEVMAIGDISAILGGCGGGFVDIDTLKYSNSENCHKLLKEELLKVENKVTPPLRSPWWFFK